MSEAGGATKSQSWIRWLPWLSLVMSAAWLVDAVFVRSWHSMTCGPIGLFLVLIHQGIVRQKTPPEV